MKAGEYKSAEKALEAATAEVQRLMKGIGAVEFVREAA